MARLATQDLLKLSMCLTGGKEASSIPTAKSSAVQLAPTQKLMKIPLPGLGLPRPVTVEVQTQPQAALNLVLLTRPPTLSTRKSWAMIPGMKGAGSTMEPGRL